MPRSAGMGRSRITAHRRRLAACRRAGDARARTSCFGAGTGGRVGLPAWLEGGLPAAAAVGGMGLPAGRGLGLVAARPRNPAVGGQPGAGDPDATPGPPGCAGDRSEAAVTAGHAVLPTVLAGGLPP